MNAKNRFTQGEIDELRRLIMMRIKASSGEQKKIRRKMRGIGFYGSNYGISDLQPAGFERLIRDRLIKIVEKNFSPDYSEPTTMKKNVSIINQTPDKPEPNTQFEKFDPLLDSPIAVPNQPGNYLVCLRKECELPECSTAPAYVCYNDLKVIYTGISAKSLRNRDYKQHFTGNNAGKSTLRKSLGSLMGYKKISRDKDPGNGKTKFENADEMKLSSWMQKNLLLFFSASNNPGTIENELIKRFNPPLNLSKNTNAINQEYRRNLKFLRK